MMEILSSLKRDKKGADWTHLVTRSQSHLSLGCVELPLVEFSVSERDDDAGRACRTQTLQVLSHNRPNLRELPYRISPDISAY